MATQTDLYNLALSVGLSPSAAKTAASVGMAESGGNAGAHNTNAATGDDSYGYWQINMLGDLGPERRKLLGISSNEQLFDPATNARAMKVISSNGTNFYPWSAYRNRTYLKFIDNPVTDTRTSDSSWLTKLSSAVTSPITAPIDAAQSLSGAVVTLTKAARWVSNSENWLRVGYVAGGAVLAIAGLVMVMQSTSAGRAVTNLVPAGRVANVVRKATS